MSILDKHLELVNEQLRFHEERAAHFATDRDPYRQKRHQVTAERFRALKEDLEAASRQLDQYANGPVLVPDSAYRVVPAINLEPGDIEGLPEELLKELSITTSDRVEFAIKGLLEEAGGVASLDKILVGLYRKLGEVHKRQSVISRLYRMAQKDVVFTVPGKKGVYALSKLSDGQAIDLTS